MSESGELAIGVFPDASRSRCTPRCLKGQGSLGPRPEESHYLHEIPCDFAESYERRSHRFPAMSKKTATFPYASVLGSETNTTPASLRRL
jgi:hypothetical protein